MRFPLGIETLGFPLDAKRGELVPFGTFQAVLDHVAAGPFDDPGSDRVAGGQVFVIAHPMLMGLEIVADGLDPLAFGAGQGSFVGPVSETRPPAV